MNNLHDELDGIKHEARMAALDDDQRVLSTLYGLRNAVEAAISAVSWLPVARAEAEFWKAKYDALLSESIKTSESVTAGILRAELHRGERGK